MPVQYPTFEAFRNALNMLAQQKFEQQQKIKEEEFQMGLVRYQAEQAMKRTEKAGKYGLVERRPEYGPQLLGLPAPAPEEPDIPTTGEYGVLEAQRLEEELGRPPTLEELSGPAKAGFGVRPFAPTTQGDKKPDMGKLLGYINSLERDRTQLLSSLGEYYELSEIAADPEIQGQLSRINTQIRFMKELWESLGYGEYPATGGIGGQF